MTDPEIQKGKMIRIMDKSLQSQVQWEMTAATEEPTEREWGK